MKNFKYDIFDESSSILDCDPEEPNLCALNGYDDCYSCYYRVSTIKRIQKSVKQLHREAS
jgi:hypothetical protein